MLNAKILCIKQDHFPFAALHTNEVLIILLLLCSAAVIFLHCPSFYPQK
jgi:hypothetical protein